MMVLIGALETGLVLVVYQRLPLTNFLSCYGFRKWHSAGPIIHTSLVSNLQMNLTNVLIICLVVQNGSANLSRWMRPQMKGHLHFIIVRLWIV